MTRKQLATAYLDWVNNYVTIATYAEHYGLTEQEAIDFLNVAQSCYYNQHPEA